MRLFVWSRCVVRCLSFDVCCFMPVVFECWLLFVDCGLLVVVRCSLLVVCCVLFGVRCLMLVAGGCS